MVLFSGKVPTKLRGDIVNDFNRVGRGAQVMLLSLGAGGVGLNLVGANHLFLLDMHWNPQLESQVKLQIFLSTRAPGKGLTAEMESSHSRIYLDVGRTAPFASPIRFESLGLLHDPVT